MGDFNVQIANAVAAMVSATQQDDAEIVINSNLMRHLTGTANRVDLVEDGVSVYINQNRTKSHHPNTRNIVSMTPESVILIKKKAFSTLKSTNDLQWMDKSEKFLLRATKTLFAYKTTQIRAYEALTKLENLYEKNRSINLLLFSELLFNTQMLALPSVTKDQQTNYLFEQFENRYGPSEAWSEAKRIEFQAEIGVASATNDSGLNLSPEGHLELLVGNVRRTLSEVDYGAIDEYNMADFMGVLRRNAFSADAGLTTWIVDPSNTDNFTTGPGTGVIELTLYNSFTTNCSVDSSVSQTQFVIEDPYRMTTVIEDDIELAINEALSGSVGLLDAMSGGSGYMAGQNQSMPLIDGAMVGSSMLELMGLGSFDDSLDIDYVRDRLRVFYLGKPFINAADSVNIFIRGNRFTKDFSSSGTALSSTDLLDQSEFSMDEVMLKAEKKLYTDSINPDAFDLDAYMRVRDKSALSMIHIFGGFVTNTSSSYSNGKNTVTVNCVDNMEWLRWSRVIGQPALNDPQGLLEDPVTPFDIKTDASGSMNFEETPELLYENKILLKTGLLSYNSGILNGQFASEENIVQGQYNQGGSLFGAMKIQAPSGFVYRWKRGIVTATAGLTSDNPLFNDWATISQYQEPYGVSIGEDVFNNLDVANILSMLIVGQPYNVEMFIRQAYEIQGISNTSASSLSSLDPLFSVLSATRKQNIKFGNFKPYRVITMSSSSVERLASDSVLKTQTNTKIEQLQRRKAEIRVLIRKLKPKKRAPSDLSSVVKSLETELASVDAGIQVALAKVNMDYDSLHNVGYETEFNLFGETQDMANSGNYEADQNVSRAMTQVGAQRRVDDVRMNNDQNLFIISDQYDTNTDIKTYIFQLKKGGWNLFSGQFYTTYEKCIEASNILNLEFFCNTAGHLELRPPQWNRTPLSVLKDYIELSKSKNTNIMPEFLQNLFQTRVTTLKIDIHALNIKISLISLLMGFFPDAMIIPGMTTKGSDSLKFFGILAEDIGSEGSVNSQVQVSLITEPPSGFGGFVSAITKGANLVNSASKNGNFGFNLDIAGGEAEGDILEGDTTTQLGDFDPITQEALGSGISKGGEVLGTDVIDVLFPTRVVSETDLRTSPVAGGIFGSGGGGLTVAAVARVSVVQGIRKAFKKLSGVDVLSGIAGGREINRSDFAAGNSAIPVGDAAPVGSDFAAAQNIINESIKTTKKFELLKELQNAISARDSKVSTLQGNIAKQEELEEIERMLTSGNEDPFADLQDGPIQGKGVDVLKGIYDVTKTTIDIMTGDATEATLWDHLIIDDTRNYLGPGSGRRFVIKNHDVIKADFKETPPEFTRVNVVGDAPIYGDTFRKSFEGLAFWCGATDFDLWRQYGYKQGSDVKLNFASHAELQCKPFAILMLQLQRARINTGSITVTGNEYYQPGDVIYVPFKGLLYYVTQVNHSFQMGSSFSTTLSLTNGHPVGTYLPSPFDIIGQQFVGNPLHETTLVHRSTTGDDAYIPLQPDCVILFPPSPEINDDNVSTLLDYQSNQLKYYNMMLDLSSRSVMLDGTYVVIRGFIPTSSTNIDEVEDRMNIVKDLLINPVHITQGAFSTSGADDVWDAIGETANAFGLGGSATNSTKDLDTMILPNGSLARSVPEEKIILQLVDLTDENKVNYNIKCMNRDIFQQYEVEQGKPTAESGRIQAAKNKFSAGGLSQNTWLEARDGVLNGDGSVVSRVIEVGIIRL